MNKKHFLLPLIMALFLTQCANQRPRPGLVVPKDVNEREYGNINVALVLGAGGSRGIAHAGVIEVLEENNIPIDLIVGSSAGSAVAALYADTKSAAKVKDILFKAKAHELIDFSLADSVMMFSKLAYPVRGQAYENFMFDNIKAKSFAELKIPVAMVTVDAATGEKFVINDGPIAPAIRASSAVPPIISPVSIYHRTLFDGAVLEPVPVETAKMYNPKLTIAIDIGNPATKKRPANFMDLTYKAIWLSYYKLSRMQAAMADIDIHPDLKGHGMMEDDRKEELYQLGRAAAIKAMPEIKRKLRALRIKSR